jgi:hypothetical protein
MAIRASQLSQMHPVPHPPLIARFFHRLECRASAMEHCPKLDS